MAYSPYPPGYPAAGYQPGYYTQAVPDQLTQLRLQQGQQLQPMQAQPQMNSMQQPQGESGGIIWVQGEAGAKAVASVHKAPKRMSWGETLDMA